VFFAAGMCSAMLLLLHRLRPVGSQQISSGVVPAPAPDLGHCKINPLASGIKQNNSTQSRRRRKRRCEREKA